MRQKNKIITGIIVFLLLFITLYYGKKDMVKTYSNNQSTVLFSPGDSAILAVNDIKVYKDEYLIHLKKEIALTYNHFYLNYKVENHPGFWTSTYGNTRPIDYLKEKTNKRLVHSKILHQLAAENKVISEFNFDVFITQWKAYNKERKEKYKSGKTVYGAIQYDKSHYYDYLLNNLEFRLEDKLKKSLFTPSETQLKDYYEIIKHKRFGYVEKLEVEQLEFPFREFGYKQVEKYIEALDLEKLDDQALCCELKNKYPKAKYNIRVFYDSIPIYGEDNPDKMLKAEALGLKYGERKAVRTQEGVSIIKLKNPLKMQYRIYNEVKEEVLWDYQDEKCKQFIKESENNAIITYNHSIYDALSEKDFK